MRIGHGFDSHKFAPLSAQQNGFVLAGVEIPYELSLLAHSDGDVLIHALCDALLGAIAKGDIGQHFPDSDPQYRGISSRVLLQKVMELVTSDGFAVTNVDVTVICQRPKLAPHIAAMRENLAQDLAVSVDQVNVKATTSEGLGYEGEGLGISVHAVALLLAND